MAYHEISDKYLKEFKELCDEKGIKYETEEEYKSSASSLVELVDLLVQMDMEERARKKRLEDEPKGYALEGKGRNCSLCGRSVYEGDGWYDKWGFKCMNCQDAVNKKKIPGSLCGDWNHEKYMTDSMISWKTGLHTQTIRKLIRRGDIKARQIPKGPYLVLRKDNPDITGVLAAEKKLQEAKAKT